MPKKLTNEIIDQRLIGKNIKRIGDYTNKRTKIECRCLVEGCNNTWKVLPLNMLKRNSCAECSMRVRGENQLLTTEIVDARLLEKNIKRLDPYLGSKFKIKFQCLINGCIWEAISSHLLHYNVGCPVCADTTFTNEMVDATLFSKNIKRLDDYINNKTKINFQCLNEKCNNIWKTAPQSIFNRGTGCPNCRGFKNEKLVNRILKESFLNFEKQKYLQNINNKETNKYRVDFYFGAINTIIEYNGAQHYQPTRFYGIEQEIAEANFFKQQIRDRYIEQFCITNNIKLITIDGRKFFNDRLEKYLIEKIIPQITDQSNRP